MIEFRNVEKRYPDGTLAVQRLNLEIPTGKTTVFVGPSGCGKTTSLRMINRMIEPSDGTIWIDGVNSTTLDKGTLRRSIGYVIQNAGLFPHRTVAQNVMTVPRLNGVPRKQAEARALELLTTVGLSAEMATKFPAQLSGGQQQRVGVARALAAEPRVLLMDEPFSALDPVVRSELQDEFMRLGRELGTTIVFVTHDIDEAIKLGDRIAVFERGGHLAQFGTPETILANPANEFVSEFVGQDRGYRGLSFLTSDDLPLRPVYSVTVDQHHAETGWCALVAGDGAFLRWEKDYVPGSVNQAKSTSGSFTEGASLRTVLDAVLTSPSGHAVCIDRNAHVLGQIGMQDIANSHHVGTAK